jgi:hypothetical protein
MMQKRREHERIIRQRSTTTSSNDTSGSAQGVRDPNASLPEDVDEGLDIDENDDDENDGDAEGDNSDDNDTDDDNDDGEPKSRGTKRKQQSSTLEADSKDAKASTTDDAAAASGNGVRKRVKKTDFRDAKFFLTAMPADGDAEKGFEGGDVGLRHGERLEDMTLDIDADDAEGLNKQKQSTIRKWDRKKKKFITTVVGSDPLAKGARRNESGAKIGKDGKKGASDLYERWKKKNRRTIGGNDGADEGDALGYSTPHIFTLCISLGNI